MADQPDIIDADHDEPSLCRNCRFFSPGYADTRYEPGEPAACEEPRYGHLKHLHKRVIRNCKQYLPYRSHAITLTGSSQLGRPASKS